MSCGGHHAICWREQSQPGNCSRRDSHLLSREWMLPNSRATFTQQSSDPTEPPLIDPNYDVTPADCYVIREGVRKLMEVVCDAPRRQEMIVSETVPEGLPALRSSSSDDGTDVRVAQSSQYVVPVQ